MRKFLLPILLASVAATPSFAQRPDRTDRQEARADRQQDREDRQQAREEPQQSREDRTESRADRVDRQVGSNSSANHASGRADAGVRANAVGRADQASVEAIRAARDSSGSARIGGRATQQGLTEENVTREQKEVRPESVRKRDIREHVRVAPSSESRLSSAERQQLREKRVAEREVRQADRRAPVVSRTPVEGSQPPPPTEARHTNPAKWSTSWRHNSNYDWWNWRKRNSWLFHLGYYNDPFGWGYRPYSIGWRMWPSYYRSSYWLSDPWDYRLPYAPPGYRWIRYYDDAILIDTWNGQIVDVIYNFFW